MVLATHLLHPQIAWNGERDQWGHATHDDHSHDGLWESAQCSDTAIGEHTGENVHFNMFKKEAAKNERIRFSFFGDLLETVDSGVAMGDPAEIDTIFFKSRGLPDGLKDKLQSHKNDWNWCSMLRLLVQKSMCLMLRHCFSTFWVSWLQILMRKMRQHQNEKGFQQFGKNCS